MISLFSKHFNSRSAKIGSAITKIAIGKSIWSSRVKHDVQPLTLKKGAINKPQDKSFAKKMKKANVRMSHLEDKTIK